MAVTQVTTKGCFGTETAANQFPIQLADDNRTEGSGHSRLWCRRSRVGGLNEIDTVSHES